MITPHTDAFPLSALSPALFHRQQHATLIRVTNLPNLSDGTLKIFPHPNGLVILDRGCFFINGDPKQILYQGPFTSAKAYPAGILINTPTGRQLNGHVLMPTDSEPSALFRFNTVRQDGDYLDFAGVYLPKDQVSHQEPHPWGFLIREDTELIRILVIKK